MTITSKFNGKCKKCGGLIAQGQQIEWDKETGPRHISCPAKQAAGNPAGDPRRPYHGKFQRAKEAYDQAQATVGSAELDAEHAAVTGPAAGDPLARISAYLGKLAPLDGLRIAAALLQMQQKRVDTIYRKTGAAA